MAKFGERVQVGAAIAQALAVVAGILISVNEFVLKDRAADKQLLELTIEIADRGQVEPVTGARTRLGAIASEPYPPQGGALSEEQQQQLGGIDRRLNQETRPLAHFYNLVARCYEAGVCEPRVMLALTCDDVHRDAAALDEIVLHFGGRWVRPQFFGGLAHMRRLCGTAGQEQSAVDADDMWGGNAG